VRRSVQWIPGEVVGRLGWESPLETRLGIRGPCGSDSSPGPIRHAPTISAVTIAHAPTSPRSSDAATVLDRLVHLVALTHLRNVPLHILLGATLRKLYARQESQSPHIMHKQPPLHIHSVYYGLIPFLLRDPNIFIDHF